MSDRVQRHLRDVLADRAAAFPYARATDRLSRIDYKPRYGRRLSARALGALSVSGTAVITAAIAVILTVGGSPPPAFAGWSAVPKALTSTQFTAIAHSVRDNWAPRCSGSGGSIVLADVRGPYTFALYVSSANMPVRLATICLNGVEHGSGGLQAGRQWPPPVAARRTSSFFTEYGTIGSNARVVSPFAFTEVGRAGADVRSVTMLLSTGTRVQATVAHGWYLVWWPAKEGYSKKLIVTTTSARSPGGSNIYEIADNNDQLPGCGAGPATDAALIRAEAKHRHGRSPVRSRRHC